MRIALDTSNTKNIGNRFSNVSLWHYLGTTVDESFFHEDAEHYPAGWLKNQYPWLEEVQLFAATGGSYIGYTPNEASESNCEFDRDLFIDPSDRSVTDDYDFSPLIRACRNILRQGLKPILKLHGIPLKLSKEPCIGWFRMNVRPPEDYTLYVNYLIALIKSLCTEFGTQQVRFWRWFVGTEMENRSWWDPASSQEDGQKAAAAYLEFYDWSVFALESVLGEDLNEIGAHAMMAGNMTGAFWDPELLVAHCRTGINHATGKKGTRLDTFAISVYDHSLSSTHPREDGSGLPSSCDLSHFELLVDRTRKMLDRNGFTHVPIEVSEGGILYGSDDRWLWYGLAPGGIYDASWTALSFLKMLQLDVSRWSRWPLFRTSGLFDGPKCAATRLLELIARMSDSTLMAASPIDGTQDSYCVMTYHNQSKTIRLLIFTHRSFQDREDRPAQATLHLSLPRQVGCVSISGSVERIDDAHGDFWPSWLEDRKRYSIASEDYVYSSDQVDARHALASAEHRQLWDELVPEYEKIADRRLVRSLILPVEEHTVTLEVDLSQNIIELYTLRLEKEASL